jgi:hypothetical protein
MPTFEIIEGKRWHCGEMARRLRAEQAEATVRFGEQPHRRLVEVFESSSWCKAWMIDGQLGGLGGLHGPLIASEVPIWLSLTSEACRYPVALMKETRRQLQEIMRTRRKIVTLIFEGDMASMRFALKLGFEICGDRIEQNGQVLLPVSLWT